MCQLGDPQPLLGSAISVEHIRISPIILNSLEWNIVDYYSSDGDDDRDGAANMNRQSSNSSQTHTNGSPFVGVHTTRPAANSQISAQDSMFDTGDEVDGHDDDENHCSLGKTLLHRLDASGSVQAVAVDDAVLFAGLQGGEIVAWSLTTYEQLARIHAHEQSVLSLALSEDKSLLFSCGVDSVVNVWSTSSLSRLYSLHSEFEVGDVFCVTYSTRIKTVFCGAQNSSIQWHELEDLGGHPKTSLLPWENRKHLFFDSLGPGGVRSPRPLHDDHDQIIRPEGGHVTTFAASNYLPYAHKSYIYSIQLAKGLSGQDYDQEVLITSGGGGTIKIWSINHVQHGVPVLLQKFKNKTGSVFSLTYQAPFLYAGLAHGMAHIYNLASRQLVHKLQLGDGDVLQIGVSQGSALCGTSQGWIKRTSKHFTESDQWMAHSGKILATATSRINNRNVFITGGNDNKIAFWDLTDKTALPEGDDERSNDELVNSLRQFVAYRTVASNPACVSDCHQAATFLRKLCISFGATTSFISPQDGINPILLAKFAASKQPQSKRTILFYGHYDVVDADHNIANSDAKWHADPFTLRPSNGYLYGRGVTDNKGPILAALYAVADLSRNHDLSCNLVFLLEGDEEAGSRGFRSAVRKHKKDIGDVDHVILSNSYWLDDHIPCLTFGMRGVLHANVRVTSSRPDLHSGMDGALTQNEPLKDLTVLLASLIGPNGKDIAIPGFYDAVAEMHPNELETYSKITSSLVIGHPEIQDHQSFTHTLVQKWREPNLTIHQIHVPETKTAVTISRAAQAAISVRIVPNQSADEMANQLQRFLQERFASLQSTNAITVEITSKADPWLGKIRSDLYASLTDAITRVWHTDNSPARTFPRTGDQTHPRTSLPRERTLYRSGSGLSTTGTFTPLNTPSGPLFVREGGSIPAISFLEREFDAPAAMFPMGQASDNAHLDNERIRVENLYKGREVLRRVFSTL